MAKRSAPLSIRDQIYESIKEEILANRYAPGAELQIESLAGEFGVSTTPVREALIRLSNAGLVLLNPNKGVRVAPIRAEDVRHIYELRLLLEPYAAVQTVMIASAMDLRELEARIDAILAGSQRPSDYRDTDFAVHEMLYASLANVLLKDIMRNLFQLSLRVRYFAQEGREIRHDVAITAAREHLAIIDAMKRGDVKAVEAAVREHIVQSRDRVLQSMATLPKSS